MVGLGCGGGWVDDFCGLKIVVVFVDVKIRSEWREQSNFTCEGTVELYRCFSRGKSLLGVVFFLIVVVESKPSSTPFNDTLLDDVLREIISPQHDDLKCRKFHPISFSCIKTSPPTRTSIKYLVLHTLLGGGRCGFSTCFTAKPSTGQSQHPLQHVRLRSANFAQDSYLPGPPVVGERLKVFWYRFCMFL